MRAPIRNTTDELTAELKQALRRISHLPQYRSASPQDLDRVKVTRDDIDQLAAAGLLDIDDRPDGVHLRRNPFAPGYNHVVGIGRYYATVEVTSPDRFPGGLVHDASLLATIVGAEVAEMDSHGSIRRIRLRAYHPTGTDFEHDAASLADFVLANPTIDYIGSTSTTMIGFLTGASMYPRGTDPLTVNGEGVAPGETCDSEHCHHPGHPLMRYMPPEDNPASRYIGHPAKITWAPLPTTPSPIPATVLNSLTTEPAT